MHNFTIGSGQPLQAVNEMALLAGIEAALDFCLDAGNVFAIFDWNGNYCQIFLDADHDMHLETTYGELAAHAGFHEKAEQWPSHSGNFLPASWHARAKMVAGAMTRAFIDAGKMSFPVRLSVDILPTGNAVTGEPQTIQTPATPGAQTIGFALGADRPMGWFVERLGAALGLYAATASIDDVKNRIQTRWESEVGPLNRVEVVSADTTIVVELGGSGPASRPGCWRYDVDADGALHISEVPQRPGDTASD